MGIIMDSCPPRRRDAYATCNGWERVCAISRPLVASASLGEMEACCPDLAGFFGGALAGPHQPFAVRGEDGQDVGEVGMGQAGLVGAGVAHQGDLVGLVAFGAGPACAVAAGGGAVWG